MLTAETPPAAAPPGRDSPATSAGRLSLPLAILLGKLAAAAFGLLLATVALVATLVGAGVIAPGGCGGGGISGPGVPPALVPIYEAASARFALGARGPSVLAAINAVETDFGRDLSTSTAGAMGWMQFEPGTWSLYAVDGDADGVKDPRDAWDAIFSAAHYLSASGAPADWHRAIFTYNHAGWYVDEVLSRAARYAGGAARASASDACAAAAAGGGRLGRIVAEANRIDRLRSVYVYGGGHVTPAPAMPPWDCSSSWSRLLQIAGYPIETMTSSGFMTWGDPGPGRWVTIYATPAHVYGTIAGRPWGTSGGDNPRDPGGGPAWLPYRVNPVPDFPGGQPTVRHPPGL